MQYWYQLCEHSKSLVASFKMSGHTADYKRGLDYEWNQVKLGCQTETHGN